MIKRSCCRLAFFLVVLPLFLETVFAQASISAPNFLRLNENFCTGGQPAVEDLERLKQEGVRAILNLRRPEEDPAGQGQEQQRVEELGLKYFAIPVDSAKLDTGQAEEFLRIIGQPENRPLFIHCRSGNRVGAFWLIYRVLEDGWSCERAEEEARKIGLTLPHLLEFAKAYIQDKKPTACLASSQRR